MPGIVPGIFFHPSIAYKGPLTQLNYRYLKIIKCCANLFYICADMYTLIAILTPLILLFIGGVGLFKPDKFVNFYMNAAKKGNQPNKLLLKVIEQKWFYLNLKICSIFMMLLGIIILAVVVMRLYIY